MRQSQRQPYRGAVLLRPGWRLQTSGGGAGAAGSGQRPREALCHGPLPDAGSGLSVKALGAAPAMRNDSRVTLTLSSCQVRMWLEGPGEPERGDVLVVSWACLSRLGEQVPVSAKEFSGSPFLSWVYQGQDPPRNRLYESIILHTEEHTARTGIHVASWAP